MLLVTIYEYIIFLIVTVWTYTLCRQYQIVNFDRVNINRTKSQIGVFFLVIFLVFLIGLRPMENGMSWMWGDSANYRYVYYLYEGLEFVFDEDVTNLIWDNLFAYWASKRWGISNLFLLGDLIYFGGAYLACRKWFQKDTTLAFLVFVGAFSTYSYSYNGVKAGIAASLFLVGLAYYENKLVSILFILLSWGFHHSMQMPVAAYILTLFFKSPKWYFYGWAFCVLMAVLHIQTFASIFANYSDDTGMSYLTGNQGEATYNTGFRLDFILYSAIPVWIGYIIEMKQKIKVSKLYSVLLHMYICTNGIWMLCMYASYSNRIAYLSWFMYPFVLIYPFLRENLRGMKFLGTMNQYEMASKVAKYHIGFTLFMEIIYYNLLK